jgi:hypothetical protein
MSDSKYRRTAGRVWRVVTSLWGACVFAYMVYHCASTFNQAPPAEQIIEIWAAIFLGGMLGMGLFSCAYLRFKKRWP